MPIPLPRPKEKEQDFISRCIAAISDEYDREQAAAIAYKTWREAKGVKAEKLNSIIDDELNKYFAFTAPKVIAVDVDGTLEKDGAPNTKAIEWCKLRKQEGYTLYLWSMAGEKHARNVAEKLKITDLFANIISKPGFILDDQGWQWTEHSKVIQMGKSMKEETKDVQLDEMIDNAISLEMDGKLKEKSDVADQAIEAEFAAIAEAKKKAADSAK